MPGKNCCVCSTGSPSKEVLCNSLSVPNTIVVYSSKSNDPYKETVVAISQPGSQSLSFGV